MTRTADTGKPTAEKKPAGKHKRRSGVKKAKSTPSSTAAKSTAAKGADKVPCPDCGRSFSKRGLAGHRRMKHPEPKTAAPAKDAVEAPASAGAAATTPAAPAVAVVAESAGSEAEAQAIAKRIARENERPVTVEVYATLTTLCTWLQRVEGRLANIEALSISPTMIETSGGVSVPADAELEDLRAELQNLLVEINHVKAAAAAGNGVGEAHKRLGDLRLRQAQILMRMGPDAPGARSKGLLSVL